MSQENADKVRAMYDAWNEGDVERVIDIAAPDWEFVTSGVYPGLDHVYRGHEGFRKYWSDFRSAWDNLRIDVKELRARGDRVVGLYRFEATARDGMKVRRDAANVWTFRDGQVTRTQAFGDWDAALDAMGQD